MFLVLRYTTLSHHVLPKGLRQQGLDHFTVIIKIAACPLKVSPWDLI